MKKKLLMMLAVMLLLVGCGNANTPDTEADTQQTESQSTSETETLEANTEVETTEVESTTEVSTEAESEAPQPSEEPSEPQAPQYTYTDLNKTMYAKSSVNVRNLPSTDGEKLGGLSKGQEVSVSGQCNETGWYRIDYNGGVAYVSNSYLVNEKPVEETPAPEEPTQPSQPTVESFPYALNSPWYDATEDCVYYYFANLSDGNVYIASCQLLDQYTTKMGVHTATTQFIGTYAEGDVYLDKVYIMPVN